jgi:diguanylate cyclase (GGDEF)-like protein
MWRRSNQASPAARYSQAGVNRSRRRHSFGPAVALGVVLIALSAYTVIGTVRMAQAVQRHSRSLTVDAWFGEARDAVGIQEMEMRHYQVEQNIAVRSRRAAAVESARAAFDHVVEVGDRREVEQARRLNAEVENYVKIADRLMDMVTDQDPAAIRFDRLETTPMYYSLKQNIDDVVVAFHQSTQRQAVALRRAQKNMLIGTSIGYGAGLVLVVFIGGIMLGYQQRLAEHARQNARLAMHDNLTGLPNRAVFRQELAALEATWTPSDPQIALMMIDLNGFKKVNDTLGHQAGDQLLVECSRRLSAALRGEDMVARLGGDEFAVLLPAVQDEAEARAVAERLADALRKDFSLAAGPVTVSGSFGVALGPRDASGDELISHADAAMYRAKVGRHGVCFHGSEGY